MRGDKPFVFTNCLTGEGIADVMALIMRNVLFDVGAGPSMSVLDAPELAPYHDEPKQMPSGAPGKHGVLDMSLRP